MSTNLRKTVIVGIGGTGIGAVLNMKRDFTQSFGYVPKIVQVCCFDTDTQDSRQGYQDIQVKLEGSEFEHVTLGDPQSVLDAYEDVRAEFPVGKVRMRALLTGAGMIRPRGRLSLLANAGAIHTNLLHAYQTVNDLNTLDAIKQSSEFNLSQDPFTTAYVVCSLAGGTGAGMFLDVAYLLRSIMDTNDRIIGVFLLPDIFTSLPGTEYVQGNTYACLKELDYLMDRELDQTDIVKYGADLSVDWALYYPYDQVFLIDNKNEDGGRVNLLPQVIRFIGRAIFANTNVVAEREDDVIDNLAGQKVALEPWTGGKMPYYASFGAAALELPIERLIESAVMEATGRVVNGFLNCESESVEEEVVSFSQAARITEGNSDHVKDSILSPKIMAPVYPEEPYWTHNAELAAAKISQWRDSAIEALDTEYNNHARASFGVRLPEARQAVSDRLEHEIVRDGGVAYSKVFAETLRVRLVEDRATLERDKAELSSKLSTLEASYPPDHEVLEACRRTFSKPHIEKVLTKILKIMADHSELLLGIARIEKSIDLLADLAELVRSYEERIGHVEQVLITARASLSRKLKRIQDKKEPNSFTKYLDSKYLSSEVSSIMENVSVASVLSAMKSSSESPLLWALPEWDSERVVERIRSLVAPPFEALREYGMEEVLSGMRSTPEGEQEMNTLLKDYLVDRATPLWKYNKSIAGRKNLAEIFIFGVADEGSSILVDLDAKKFGVSGYRYELASTGDKHSISAFKYKLRVPAFIIDGMDRYRDEYVRHEYRKDFTHHIRRIWAENPDMLGDLFPDTTRRGTETQRMFWAVAFSKPFNLIWHTQGWHYYVKSQKVGKKVDDFAVLLDHGRQRAFDKFVGGPRSQELFAEVRERVDAIVKEKGNDLVISELKSYMQHLVDESRGATQDVKALLEEECNAIDAFIEGLSTIQ